MEHKISIDYIQCGEKRWREQESKRERETEWESEKGENLMAVTKYNKWTTENRGKYVLIYTVVAIISTVIFCNNNNRQLAQQDKYLSLIHI